MVKGTSSLTTSLGKKLPTFRLDALGLLRTNKNLSLDVDIN